jgi:hypothetical protein
MILKTLRRSIAGNWKSLALLELAAAIKAGEMFVKGSLSYDRFWDRLPAEAADPAAISEYADDRGWQGGADGLVKSVKEALERHAGTPK